MRKGPFTVALALLLATASCHRGAHVAVAPPRPAPTIILVPSRVPLPLDAPLPAELPVAIAQPAPPPVPSPEAMALESGTEAFANGEYLSAARAFQKYLELVPADGLRDTALFHLGLIYAFQDIPGPDWIRASGYLRQLILEFPQDPMRPAAQLLLTLREEAVQLASDVDKRDQRIRQLNSELDRLKQIDSTRRQRP